MVGAPITPQKAESVKEIFGKEFEDLLNDAIKRNLVSEISIGVLSDKECRFANVGKEVSSNWSYEIGSITKSFTCELLHKLIEKGTVKWDDRLDSFLPQHTSTSPEQPGSPITLGDLARHHAGLPLLPTNLGGSDRSNPYGSYSETDLVDYFSELGPIRPEEKIYNYSNIGYAALGYALEQASGKRYADLLREELLTPLRLDDTHLALTGQDGPPIIQGRAQGGKPVGRWSQDAFASAGGLCSSASDVLLWCQFLLSRMKERTDEMNIAFGDRTTKFSDYLNLHEWLCHSGMTGGFFTLIGLNSQSNSAIVLLGNRRSPGVLRAITENAIRALNQDPLLPLTGDYGMRRANLLDGLRGSYIGTTLIDTIKSSKLGVLTTGTIRKFLDPN